MTYPTRVTRIADARARFGERADRLAEFLSVCDPLADACVDAFAAMPPGRGFALLDRALKHGIDSVEGAPDALIALFAELDHVPAWVDRPLMDRGGELLLRVGSFGGMVLGFRSLVLAYAAPGGNKPLVLSGRLTEQAPRRLAETARFVHATAVPGNLRRYGDAFAVTVKVRLMHAQVRRLTRKSGKWRSELWGEPVNQHDMVGTILLFSVSLLDGLRTIGFRIDDEEAHAYVQLWRYSGHLLGVHPELLPASEAEARRTGEIIRALQGPPDADARALVDALFGPGLGEPSNAAEAAFLVGYRRFAKGLSRVMNGDELADSLGLPRGPARFAPRLLRPAIGALERVRLRSELAQRALVSFGDARWKRVIEVGLAGESADFQLPNKLGKAVTDPNRGAGASASP